MQDVLWRHSLDRPWGWGEVHSKGHRKEVNVTQSQEPFQKRNSAKNCQSPTICSWRNKCLSPEGEFGHHLTESITMEATEMVTEFPIFKSPRGWQKCLMSVFISESYLKNSQSNFVYIL